MGSAQHLGLETPPTAHGTARVGLQSYAQTNLLCGTFGGAPLGLPSYILTSLLCDTSRFAPLRASLVMGPREGSEASGFRAFSAEVVTESLTFSQNRPVFDHVFGSGPAAECGGRPQGGSGARTSPEGLSSHHCLSTRGPTNRTNSHQVTRPVRDVFGMLLIV